VRRSVICVLRTRLWLGVAMAVFGAVGAVDGFFEAISSHGKSAVVGHWIFFGCEATVTVCGLAMAILIWRGMRKSAITGQT
jgi:hypothetical protein